MKRGIKWFLTNYSWNFVQTSIHKYWVMYYLIKYCVKGDVTVSRMKLLGRGIVHDLSKYGNSEALYFADEIFNLKKLTYGTQEYRDSLNKIKPCLEHHYANNSHHPEFYPNGYSDMSEEDKIEMIADWCAAVRRHPDGNIYKSIEINQKRFGYSNQEKHWITSLAVSMSRRHASSSLRQDRVSPPDRTTSS